MENSYENHAKFTQYITDVLQIQTLSVHDIRQFQYYFHTEVTVDKPILRLYSYNLLDKVQTLTLFR